MAAQQTGRPRNDNKPPARDPDFPLVGETLGLWRLLRGIGRGGMGEVYEGVYDYLHLLTLRYRPEEREAIRAELELLPRSEQSRLATEMLGTPLPAEARFAIKVCSARKGTAGHRRFLQEAELARRLGDHPYIVSVHAINTGEPGGETGDLDLALESGKHKDVAFMVMDLATRDYDHTRLALGDAVHVVRCIATALDHAHHHGVVHRDLKPENILGTVEHPLLTDFGIAKELDQSLGLTRTGQIIGTLDYMSPEQATDAKNVDHLSDIYSLGVVLYECATGGRLPYVHLAEREACLAAIRSERVEPLWPRAHVDGFPRSLERIVLKAMAHRKTERYQEMSEFITDLDRFTRGERIGWWGRVPPRRWWRWQRQRHPRLVWGLIGGSVAVAAAWLAFTLAALFDSTGRSLRTRLDAFAGVVESIGAEPANKGFRVQQLTPEQRQAWLIALADDLHRLGDAYPDAASRFAQLKRTYERSRYLKAVFAGPGSDPVFAKQQLIYAGAAGTQDALKGNLIEAGLKMEEDTELLLGPYVGHGVWVHLEVHFIQPGPFAVEVREAGVARHATWVEAQFRPDGAAALVARFRQDRAEPETLLEGPLRQGVVAGVWLQVLPDGILAVLSGEGSNRAPRKTVPRYALTQSPDGAPTPAEVKLVLPRGAILRSLEIFSEGNEVPR